MFDMSNKLLDEVNKLSQQEKKELIKKLVNTMDGNDIQELVEEIQNTIETLGLLKTIEPAFEDWHNERDSAYDKL